MFAKKLNLVKFQSHLKNPFGKWKLANWSWKWLTNHCGNVLYFQDPLIKMFQNIIHDEEKSLSLLLTHGPC